MVLMLMLMQGMQESGTVGEKVTYKDGFVPGVLGEKAKKALRYCMTAFPVIVCIVALYFTVFMCTEARTVIFNSYNRRQAKLEEQNARGTIFDADGNPLAFTMLSEGEEVRKYPYGSLYAHVVGQVKKGSSGLEAVKEIDLLSSSTGELSKLLYRMRDAQIPGNNLFTTLRTDVQGSVYEALAGYTGAACVIEIETGALTASVSLPDFEPEAAELYEKEENGPFFNRTFYGEYPVTDATELFRVAATVYQEGIPTPFEEKVRTDGNVLTPVGGALFAAACANGGVYQAPYVAEKLSEASGKMIYRTEPESVRLLTTEEAGRYYEAFGVRKTEEGSGYRYAEAEVDSGTLGKKHCLAMALVPAENPEVAICIVVEQRRGLEDGALQNIMKRIVRGVGQQ